jgi:integrase
MRVAEVRRRDVIALLDRIVDRGAGVQANRTLAVVRKCFNFAVERGLLETSPCTHIRAPTRETPRGRVLSCAEFGTLWMALPSLRISTQCRLLLQLLLVTAQRKSELLKAQWDEINCDAATWTIPPTLSKNGYEHSVPLSPLAMQLFSEARESAGQASWVFPSTRDRTKSLSETTVNHALASCTNELQLSHFTPHDLRRSAASHMASLGVPRLIISKILNHRETGVTAVYDRHTYDDEKRDALERWADHLVTASDAHANSSSALHPSSA